MRCTSRELLIRDAAIVSDLELLASLINNGNKEKYVANSPKMLLNLEEITSMN